MARRRYIPCTCYCPKCKRRHEGCVPEEDVKRVAEAPGSPGQQKAYYTAGHKAEYRLTTRRLPQVECTRCYGQRAGLESAALVSGMEADALKWSREHPNEGV